MDHAFSRRGVLSGAAGAAVAGRRGGRPGRGGAQDLQPLTSRSGVYTPGRGERVMQFGFDFPEPSAEIGGLLVSFRIQTFENAYAIDPARTRVLRDGRNVRWVSEGLLGRGGQEAVAGQLIADFEIAPDGVVAWRARRRAAEAGEVDHHCGARPAARPAVGVLQPVRRSRR